MSEIGAYTTIAISILSVAYPILQQVISSLDEKYSSVLIVTLFDREPRKIAFKYCLSLSLVALAFWTFEVPAPNVSNKDLQGFLNNSSVIILIVFTITLVAIFLLLVERVFLYLTPIRFVKHLLKHHKKDSSQELRYFKALTDVFISAIKKQNQELSLTIAEGVMGEFTAYRDKHSGVRLEYPDAYYSLVYRSMEELAATKDKRNILLERYTAGGRLILGGMGGSEISDTTYLWLWYNIRQAIDFDRDDMVMYHWEHAHQYIAQALGRISPDYSASRKITNGEAIEKRNLERDKFLESHIVLGGLLLYRKRYSLIKRTFDYTTSEPPRYELLPLSMEQIFKLYMKYRDIHGTTWISHRYPFPDMEGIKSDALIGRWVAAYLALLFLRQYTLYAYYGIDPLTHPSPPKSQGEKRALINGLDFFNKLVTEHLDNDELLTNLKLKFLNSAWCTTNGKVFPLDFIEQYKARLEEAYQQTAKTQEVSDDKKAMFLKATKQALEGAFDKFKDVNNQGNRKPDTSRWFEHGGAKTQMDKDTFAEAPETTHLNFDSFMPYRVAGEVTSGISSTFLYVKTKSYLLKTSDLFAAIDKMGITKDYVIVVVGIDLNDHIKQNVQGLTISAYNGIQCVELPGSQVIDPSFFVLKKDDLPWIDVTKPIPPDIARYSLESISDVYPIYASVVDLNKMRPDIRQEENFHSKTDDEMKKSVLLNIFFQLKVFWKNSPTVFQLIEYSEFRQQAIPNVLADVKPIK